MSADSLLRPALEAAVAVARQGESDLPFRVAPVGLRPFLNFAKLPPRALVAARRALDSDGAFRAQVIDEVSEELVGRAGWLFLVRPDGWEAELDTLAKRADDDRARVADHRAEDGARRKLGAAEAAARRADEVAEAARIDAARAGAALAEERRARRVATREATEMAARAETVAAERDRALAEAERVLAETAPARAEIAAARAEAEAARAEASKAKAEAAAARADAEAATAERLAAKARATAVRNRVAEPARAVVDPTSLAVSPASVARDGAGALASAADAARALGDALAAAARAMENAGPSSSPAPDAGAREAPPPLSRPSRGGRSRPSRRVPAPLPPAIFEDSSEAAEHLARLPGVVVLVDGYNVSHAGWPGIPIAEQRRRLVDALAELVARTGADVRVVFDGADTVEPPSVATTARTVRVSFSSPEVEADDVIVAEVGEVPSQRPVVVASSDRRVRDESRVRGANLLHSSQLLVLLRR